MDGFDGGGSNVLSMGINKLWEVEEEVVEKCCVTHKDVFWRDGVNRCRLPSATPGTVRAKSASLLSSDVL